MDLKQACRQWNEATVRNLSDQPESPTAAGKPPLPVPVCVAQMDLSLMPLVEKLRA